MCNCVLLDESGRMAEEISASEFAELKNEVRHQGSDIAEIKDATKAISEAIVSISVSQASMTAHIEQNSKLEPRIEKLETKMDKANTKIAVASGGATAIGLVIGYLAKLKGLIG